MKYSWVNENVSTLVVQICCLLFMSKFVLSINLHGFPNLLFLSIAWLSKFVIFSFAWSVVQICYSSYLHCQLSKFVIPFIWMALQICCSSYLHGCPVLLKYPLHLVVQICFSSHFIIYNIIVFMYWLCN